MAECDERAAARVAIGVAQQLELDDFTLGLENGTQRTEQNQEEVEELSPSKQKASKVASDSKNGDLALKRTRTSEDVEAELK